MEHLASWQMQRDVMEHLASWQGKFSRCSNAAIWRVLNIYIYILYFILKILIVTMGEGGFEPWTSSLETLGGVI